MSVYSIAFLEQITGIKAHTIRIWEQRYGIIIPERTDSNIRYYDDQQLQKLLNVVTLVNAGYKIGKLAVLPDEEINREVMDLILKESATEHAYEAFIARLISASMSYNSALFNETYERALLRFGLQSSYTNIIHPTLVRIGLLWSVNEIIPAQEHFASNLIRMKLFNAMNQLPDGDIKNTWVLFMPEHDSHEIGLLFAALMMRMSGKRVIYLGQQVPLENVIETVEQTRASGLLYFQVTTTTQQITQEIISSLEKKLNRVQRIVCASSSVLTDINCNKQTLKLSSAEEFIRWVTASKKSK